MCQKLLILGYYGNSKVTMVIASDEYQLQLVVSQWATTLVKLCRHRSHFWTWELWHVRSHASANVPLTTASEPRQQIFHQNLTPSNSINGNVRVWCLVFRNPESNQTGYISSHGWRTYYRTWISIWSGMLRLTVLLKYFPSCESSRHVASWCSCCITAGGTRYYRLLRWGPEIINMVTSVFVYLGFTDLLNSSVTVKTIISH